MSFLASVGVTNVDLMYVGMPRVPQEGEEIFSQDFRVLLGGGAPGTAVNAARLGIPTRLATYLGSDLFSGFARAQFEQNGVSPYNLAAEGETGIPVNVTSAMLTPGDRTFATYCKPTAITDELLERVYTMSKGAKLVQITLEADEARDTLLLAIEDDGHGAKLVQMQEGFLPVYRKLHEEGTILIFDMGWDDELSFEKYGDYLRLADYYTPNTKEALKITGRDTPEEALRVLAEYFEHPLVKLDKDGCLILEDGRPRLLRNIPEFTCKDSTGAGDAFLAGLMYGLYHGYPFADCVRFGNITGGKSVTGVGCLTEYVQESELLALREKYKDL